ncbi:MAG: biotin/lipoyl-binding protein [Halieaceae bacterium]
MLEFLLCSLITILPDFLGRRYLQGKRWGHEITFFSMWYELRWGITACVLLTVALITLIFYYHPSTSNASPFFRTVTMLPEGGGRVDEVFVENGQLVAAGDPLFALEESSQLAAMEVAKSKIMELDAGIKLAEAERAAMRGLVAQAQGSLDQAENELRLKVELQERDSGLVSPREIQRLQNSVESRQGALSAANANLQAVQAQLDSVLPAQRASAVDTLEQTQVEVRKTTIYAGIAGRVAQFLLQPGDYVNPILRPAGLLIPVGGVESGLVEVQAGFNQLAAPIVKPGTLAEITCMSKPFTVIPMVVVRVLDVIPAGQLRPADNLLDIQVRAKPGTLTVAMEPLYEGGLEGVFPGTKCLANAYTFNHDALAAGNLGLGEYLFLHMVDAVGIVHAVILRIQALVLPVKTLVFGGH